MNPRVIGLDLAAQSTGIALPDGTAVTLLAPKPAGKTRTLADDLARLHHAVLTIDDLLARHRPALAVIEDYTPGIRSNAVHRIAEISGCIRLACHRAGVPIALVNPMHLKIYATGKGRADKGLMRVEALKRGGVEFRNDDEADAWWLRAMGLDQLGTPVVAMPQVNRAVLAKVRWPEPKNTGDLALFDEAGAL